MTRKWKAVDFNDLKDGDPVVFFGVHMLRWNFGTWGDPKIAFTDYQDDTEVSLLKRVRPYVEDMVGIASDARILLSEIDAYIKENE